MSNRISKIIKFVYIAAFIICIAASGILMIIISRQNAQSVSQMSKITLQELNLQIQQKFLSLIDLRTDYIDITLNRYPGGATYDQDTIDRMVSSVSLRDYTYLGFGMEDRTLVTVYGKDVQLVDTSSPFGLFGEDGVIIAEGVDEDGEKMLLLGKAASYVMKDGRTSSAILLGLPMSQLNDALFLDEDDLGTWTHIISGNTGEFIIRNGDVTRDSYYDRIMLDFEPVGGKTKESYAKELSEAIAAGEEYFAEFRIDGDHRFLDATPLVEGSTWYLVTLISNSSINNMRQTQNTMQVMSIGIAMSIIVLVLLVLLLLYMRGSRLQMQRLEAVKEEALRANQAKSEFLSTMSHDIRTPMNAIIGMTEIALKNMKDPERVEDCLRKVQSSSKHLLSLINDVLDMSKIESGKMTLSMAPHSLQDTMDEMVNIAQPQVKAKNQQFDIFIQKILAEQVYYDSLRLNQVLINLLSNAVKFTPEKGSISIRLYQEESPLGEDHVRTHFFVEDTGIGMSKEFQEKVYETFSRENTEQVAHTTGTGLGMSITKSIVDMMHGTIDLDSTVGVGSKWHITLDLKKAEDEAAMSLPDWDVLVVDDNQMLCESAASNLEELGVHAEWVLDGPHAIEMIQDRHDRKEDYRLVLVDWKMPDMSGVELIRRLRESDYKDLPIFLISAYDFGDVEEEIGQVKVEGFISKPLFKTKLFHYLSKFVGDESKQTEYVESSSELDFTGKHVLVAEDIEINWEITNEILTSVGLKADHAENGEECVKMFKASETGAYDLILMDIRMPVLDGYGATKAIRALERKDNDIPIVALTADAFSDDVQYCLSVGMNDHIAKPINTKELLRLLQKFLQKEESGE